MSELIVTYGRAVGPVMSGDDVRTEKIAIGAESAEGVLEATGKDNVVRLHALAACWVNITTSPVAIDPDTPGTSFYMPSGEKEYCAIERGQKVAVIEATEGSA